jgi:hypothetical protein
MSSKTADQEADLQRVKSEYKAAFGEWAAQVGLLQTMSESAPDSPVIEEARARADAAEAVYRETRDELAGMASEPTGHRLTRD